MVTDDVAPTNTVALLDVGFVSSRNIILAPDANICVAPAVTVTWLVVHEAEVAGVAVKEPVTLTVFDTVTDAVFVTFAFTNIGTIGAAFGALF